MKSALPFAGAGDLNPRGVPEPKGDVATPVA